MSVYFLRDVQFLAAFKGNAQFLFLCNSQKSSVNFCLMKTNKKHSHKKSMCLYNSGEVNFKN